MKRSLLFFLIVILSSTIVFAAVKDQFVVGLLSYRVISEENHEVVVFADDKSISGDVEIPAEVTNNSISYSVTSISDFGFAGCTGITTVRIPASINNMGGNPFIKCSNLTEILVDDDNAVYYTVDGILFDRERSMLVAYLESRGEEYVVPEGVQLIGQSAFNSCENLRSIHFPESVLNIMYCAFFRCTNLREIYCAREAPAILSRSSFDTLTFDEGTLYVPDGALESYQRPYPWNRFCNIRTFDISGINEVMADDIIDRTIEIYNTNGQYVGCDARSLRPGLYIMRQGETTKKIVIK